MPERYEELNSAYLNDIIVTEEGNGSVLVVWLATKSGIIRMKLDNTSFGLVGYTRLNSRPGNNELHSDWISLLHVDQNGNIWAGTIGGGLSRVVEAHDGRFAFETITTKDGLLTNDVETLLEDSEGNFWIGSIGLTKYNPARKSFAYYDATTACKATPSKCGLHSNVRMEK